MRKNAVDSQTKENPIFSGFLQKEDPFLMDSYIKKIRVLVKRDCGLLRRAGRVARSSVPGTVAVKP